MGPKHYFFGSEIPLEDLGNKIRRKVLAYNDNLMMVLVQFEKGAVGKIHSHPHEQITYVLEGEFEFIIGSDRNVVKAGDSMYKEPNIPHGTTCLEKGVLLDVFCPYREDFVN